MNVLTCHDIEWFPLVSRWELEGDDWVNVRFPLNKGSARDIPLDAVLHASLLSRLRNDQTYHPSNNHGGKSAPCLKHKGVVANFVEVKAEESDPDPDHQTYKFSRANNVG